MDELVSKQAVLNEVSRWRGYLDDDMINRIQIGMKRLPAANMQPTCNNLATDTISRQAAIDIERNATVDTNPSHFEAHQKFTQFMDDAEISSFGRWQWSNGFNTALTAVGIDLKKLPSVQSKQTDCEFCHEDSNGYVCPVEKNSHAVIYGSVLHLKANGWSGKVQIKYCPMCGRRLTEAEVGNDEQ